MGRLLPFSIAGAVVAAGSGALAARRWYGTLDAETPGTEFHNAETDDGWEVGLYRRRPATDPTGSESPSLPVICGHGLAGSHLIFDLTETTSLAASLAARGFDVWMLDWRGRGASTPVAADDAGANANSTQWCFDDFVRRDFPAVVAKVRDVTGADGVLWLGHEMSGQVLYAAAIDGRAGDVRAAVTLGAPAVTPADAAVPGVTAPPQSRRNGRVPFRAGARFAGPPLVYVAPGMLADAFAPGLTEPFAVARYLAAGAPDEAIDLVDQFRSWVERGEMADRERRTIYSDHLDEIVLPIMCVAGAADKQRPPAAVRETFDALGCADKAFLLAGTTSGLHADYGHDDLVTAHESPREIVPRICDWFAWHS